MSIQKNNPRILNSWAVYDMANSVYSLCIATAIFPPFYELMTSVRDENKKVISDTVDFFGIHLKNSVLYEYALSSAFLIIALLAPILSGIADFTGNKKAFMKFFVYLGSISCFTLYFFDGTNPELAIICFMLATISFSGSFVFYNSYLPEIATPDRFEKISARGYAMGYAGSVLLLILNLMMIQKPGWFNIPDGITATRYAFVTVGLWWAGIAQITFVNLPSTKREKSFKFSYISHGFKEIKQVFRALRAQVRLRRYLVAFFFLSMGLQTVMFVASMFGKKELNLETPKLIVTVLLIQLIAIPGSYFFAWLSNRKGNMPVLLGASFIWIGICIAAFYTYTEYQFYALAAVVGWVMGGVQSLCRATFTRLLEKDKDTSSYFSFYDATEKIAIVLGTLSYGIIDHAWGMRYSVLALMIFFIIAAGFLFRIRKH